MLYVDGQAYFARNYLIHLVDRVGGGDSFGGGLIHAMRKWPDDPQQQIEFAVAASCLKQATEYDFNLCSEKEVLALVGGNASGPETYVIPIVLSLFYVAIITPIIYKFGVQKSRIIVIAAMLLPSMLVFALAMLWNGSAEEESSLLDSLDRLASIPVIPAFIMASVIAVAVYVLSLLLSMKIYNHKEL